MEIASNISDECDDWKSRFPARTKEELFKHGKSILEPVGTYYKKQFLDESGDCNAMRQMSEAAQIFDPLFICTFFTADIVTVLH